MRAASPLRPIASLRALRFLLLLAAGLAASLNAGHAQVDAGINKNVWKMLYGASAAQVGNATWLAADTDGDGLSNQAELDSGTNPFRPNSALKVTTLAATATTVSMTFSTMPKKFYLAQATVSLAPANWQNVTPAVQVLGDGSSKTLAVPKAAGAFFRVLVQDIDADGDGVADWAEQQLGLNAGSVASGGQVDFNGLPVADQVFANAQFNAQGAVSIAAVSSSAMQPAAAGESAPEIGRFRISRAGFAQFLPAVTVNLVTSGTAMAGTDYDALPATVNFGAGEVSKEILVTPLFNAARTTGASVVATVAAAAEYTIAGQGWAAVIVQPNDAPKGTGLLGRYYDTASGTYAEGLNFGQPGTFTYVRDGSSPFASSTITVPFTYVGPPAVAVGHQVRLSFTSGLLDTSAFDNGTYTVTAVNPGVSFTVGISGAALPASYSPTGSFSIQSFPHPPTFQRLDATVNFDWMGGTANGSLITPNNLADGYSSSWEGYLAPSAAGSYQFQLDADDKARVLLDLNRNGVFDLPGEQILENGWDTAATTGTYKVSAAQALNASSTSAERYRIRVEHVETTGDARCRLQWRAGAATFANIPQANIYSHTPAMTANYSYTRTGSTAPYAGSTITVSLTGHGLAVGNPVPLYFSSGVLFASSNVLQNLSGTYTVATVPTANTFTVAISGANLPAGANSVGAGHVGNQPENTGTGWFNQIYQNTTFTGPAGRIGVDANGPMNSNNGLYGAGTPDVATINPDTFSARWSGQVQPQFTEEYTFTVLADDGVALSINGQPVPLRPVASVSQGGSTYTYDGATGNLAVNYNAMLAVPNSFTMGEIVRLDPTSGNLHHAQSATYTYNAVTGDTVVTYAPLTNIAASSFAVGETVFLDPTTGNLNPLGTTAYVITAATATSFTVNFGVGTYATGPGNMTISDTRDYQVIAATATTFTVNIGTGRYTTTSGNVNVEMMNKATKDWAGFGAERFARMSLVGGKRYDIQLDYWESGGYARCQLFWYSPSQPKQIIPPERLYPSNAALAGSEIVSSTEASAIVGSDFAQNLVKTGGGTLTISGQPAWLTLNNGVLTGRPPAGAAGDYQVLVTATNALGTGTSVLNLRVDQTSANVTRERWDGVTGIGVGAIPTGTPPSGTSTLGLLQTPSNAGDNYGTRIRGYITAPTTGNYYFYLAASDFAELWISNDHEPINIFRRAHVTAGSTTALDWNAAAKSPWLALEAGQKYYFEVLHKTGTGAGDNLAVGWLQPNQTEAPAVIGGAVLSPYFDTPALASTGTLYIATMLGQPGATGPGGAAITGVGTATLRVSPDETSAVLRYNYAGLTGVIQSQHIHIDPYLAIPTAIVYDIDAPETEGDGVQPDGSHKWTITSKGGFQPADIREAIKQGKAYINLHTPLNPNGEIRGNFTLAAGSRTFTPPPPPPAVEDDSNSDIGAQRFLTQATFGASIGDIQAFRALTPGSGKTRYEKWIDDQFALATTSTELGEVLARKLSDANGGAQFEEALSFNAWWRNAITAPDQLRQRVAFALSEIHVVSAQGPLDNRADALSYFYDKLTTNAFGNFRQLLEDTTLTPAMGRYLDMRNNDKPDLTVGRIPNENYAREIKQLFAIGLYRLWPDGTLVLNSKDAPIDTYTQREIVGFAHAFTGWTDGYDGAYRTGINAPANWLRQMREVPARHFTGPKRVLNNEVLPGLPTLGGQPLDPYATHNTTHFGQVAYQQLPGQELDATHDQLFHHPNVGPFICRQLIQRLVTSNPSRDYLFRVVQKFNDNGAGVRGDMKAVIKAILLDYEARSPGEAAKPAFGKQREPLLRITAAARAFRLPTESGSYTQSGSHVLNVTMANKLQGGNNVQLEFPRSGAWAPGDTTPTSEVYSVLSTPAPTATTFAVNAKGWTGLSTTDGTSNGGVSGTYTQAAGASTITISIGSHWLGVNQKCWLDFTAATTGAALTDGIYTATSSTSTGSGDTGGTTFTIPAPDTNARTGRVRLTRFTGSYTVTNSGLTPSDRRITLDTTSGSIADHHLNVGNSIYLNFTAGNPQPIDGEFVIESVPDANTFTVLTTAAIAAPGGGVNDADNGMWMFPLVSQPLTRSGNVGAPPSTFRLDNTTDDFDQSPLNSPTVFNFFLPDYKYSGTLASQGITTPEFQLTAETTVIRSANYIYNGIFNPGNSNGISSFTSGNNALVLNYSPWMGAAPIGTDGLGAPANTALPWTQNQNLGVLIDHFATLLTAGQLSAPAKAAIKNFVATPITSMSVAGSTVVTTTVPHRLNTGDGVLLSGVADGAFSQVMNNTTTTRTVTVASPTTFTFTTAVACTTAPTAGGLANAHVSVVPYNNGTATPLDANKRDRLRAIIHLILTSPDYTIQR